jgi:TolB-like protein/Flp pilus assembly protein TadD
MPDVFISYSRKDSAHALELAEKLRASGVEIWIDKRGIEGAEHWAKEIAEGIRSCSTFLILLSPQSVVSEHVLRELSLAVEKRKRILPVKLMATELPASFEYSLAGLQRVAISDFEGILRAHKNGVDRVKIRDERKSLMILPLEDLSPASEDNEWFADGLTGELISALSNIKSLRIPDRKTSMDMKGFRGKTSEIARELDVRYFIEGNVRKFGDQIKISMELLDIDTGDYLWQHSYRGEFKDIFDMQEAVAREVVIGLKLHLTTEEEKKIRDHGTENSEAFALYLKAGEFVRRETKEGYEYALPLYLEAGRLDPSFAITLAWAANVHTSLYRAYDRNLDRLRAAEELLEQAQTIKPSLHDGLIILSNIRLLQGRLEEAESLARKFVEVEPENSNSHFALAYFYYHTHQPERAIAPYEESVQIRPDYLTAHWNLIAAFERADDEMGRVAAAERALPLFEKQIRLFPDDEQARVRYANLLFIAGRSEDASRALDKLTTVKDGDSLYNLACLAARLMNFDLAMRYLHNAIVAGFRNVDVFRTDPDLNPLRDREDFRRLVQDSDQ